ncbi:MAG: SCO1664 family protein [Actinomycetota bacterium]|nr:SCO1664 family protein [Actinomycetota bacterium]
MQVHDPATLELLRRGTLEIAGRIVEASNATLLCTIELDGVSAHCVYKPVRGERPLWDFPDGTLAGREVASYLLAQATGWGVVPPTVLRPGPFGDGMVQLWIDSAAASISESGTAEYVEQVSDLVELCAPGEVPSGWKEILRAQDYGGDVVVLAHADSAQLRRMAVLDLVLNNADRKGGHVLAGLDGGVYGVDHGICLHTENKLRTVLWGWAGESIGDEATEVLSRLAAELQGDLGEALHEHLTIREVDAVSRRLRRVLAHREMPAPSGTRPAIPWPAF